MFLINYWKSGVRNKWSLSLAGPAIEAGGKLGEKEVTGLGPKAGITKEAGCDVAEPRSQGPDHGLTMLWGSVWGILKKKILAD